MKGFGQSSPMQSFVFTTAFAAYLSLPYATFFSSALSSMGRFSSGAVNLLWFVSMISECCMFIFQMIKNHHFLIYKQLNSKYIVVFAVIGVAALATMSLTAQIGSIPLFVGLAGAVANGLSLGFMYAAWMFLLSNVEISSGKSDIVASVAFFIAMATSMVLRITSPHISMLLLIVLAVYGAVSVCYVALQPVFTSNPAADSIVVQYRGDPSVGKMSAMLALIWSAFASVELPAMAIQSSSVIGGMPMVALVAALAIASVIMCLSLWFSRAVTFSLMSRIASCLVGAGLTLFLLFPSSVQLTGYSLAFCGMTLMNLTVWIVGAHTIPLLSSGREQFFAAVLPRLVILSTNLITNAIYNYIYQQVSYIQIVMIFILLVMMAAFGCKQNNSKSIEPPPISSTPVDPDMTALRSVLETISSQGKLTKREAEILNLIARGRDAEYIRNRLCISRNTVNTHIGHIYHKLGIHSRQELLDLVEQKVITQVNQSEPATRS